MIKKLFVSDLDGTLLSSQAILSDYSIKHLSELILSKKVAFTIASARSLPSIQELLKKIPLQLPIIQLNGACITDFNTGENLFTLPLDKALASEVIHLLEKEGAKYLVTSMTDKPICYIPKNSNAVIENFNQESIAKKEDRIVILDNMTDCLSSTIISLTLIEPHKRSSVITEKLKESGLPLQVYPMGVDREGWEWTTIQSDNATKGNAVEYLCNKLEYDIAHTTTFGDNVNDHSMIEKAGVGVAMDNALEPLKKVAQKTIGVCDDHSVVKYILEHH